MTPNEERQYLCDLLLEASRWRISEDDAENCYNGLELEVRSRLQRLNGQDNEVPAGTVEEDEGAPEAAATPKMNARQRYESTHIRLVGPDGKRHSYRIEDCEQVPNPVSPTGYSWRLKENKEETA